MIPSVLIVEDEQILSEAMVDYLTLHGFDASSANTGEEGVRHVQGAEVDMVILDYMLPGINGLEVLQKIKELSPLTEVIVVTAHGSVKTAVDAMRFGAFDYFLKPVDLEELAIILDKAWKHVGMRRELRYWQEIRKKGDPKTRIIGDSEATRQLRGQVERLAALEPAPPILITGETGTGKGLVAHTVHDLSARSDRPFVEMNCAAIPAQLLESEIFGYERGAFTDARSPKAGLFESADGGTLFLDEIGAMSPELQAKLLKVIEEKTVRRLGGLRTKEVDVRIISATNSDLDKAVQNETFRADLLYRLKILNLPLPPLRDRPEDIPVLAQFFLAQSVGRYRQQKTFHEDAVARLTGYNWPGNVRELANVIERTVILHEGEEIRGDDLGLDSAVPKKSAVEVDKNGLSVDFSKGGISLPALEQTLISEALKETGGNRRRAAELLDISPETLRYRVEKYGLVPANFTKSA